MFIFKILNKFERQLELILQNIQIFDLKNQKQILYSFYNFNEEELVINLNYNKNEIIKNNKIIDSFVVSLINIKYYF